MMSGARGWWLFSPLLGFVSHPNRHDFRDAAAFFQGKYATIVSFFLDDR